MKIAIASDHAGYELKEAIKAAFPEHEFEDFGTHSVDSMDYPDTGAPAAQAVAAGKAERGILICGSGIGMSITANKVRGIRAALCTNTDLARLSRIHNDANVLCLAGRFTAVPYALEIVNNWLNSAFEGGRHQNRIEKIKLLEGDKQ
ncbi:MAG TPA: ribose 5-phosphate isomerase B [Candidatus Syntrophosphaera sp.]|jgi:ribose 5-phosphate isomerase B|nr:ribose 5-phosphate isomerase B [Candidatus Syntrophosphaera sp.]HOU72758.1 ribose 5-phosphate isomerase B [Candidatus Syntrophosphaera sp.]HPB43637.1 ribose 5-phosphate isomerase B [Candidatus Syntrophosphaera sp.]HQG94508.1 ribose 5-phosphate isomerase B [Candidatus Syntrophosphaera sp.]HQK28886.1 ribose 5-phosphate isomerase B [Candidatus Syntrophosphaera sp.]